MCYQSHNWSIFHHLCHKIFSLASLGIPQVIQLKHNFFMKLKNKCSISECLKFIEVKSNALFLSTFGVKIDVKNKRKRVSRMCENAYLSIKNPKASRALKRALDPDRRMFASLCRQLLASETGAPPWPNPGSAPESGKSWIRRGTGIIQMKVVVSFHDHGQFGHFTLYFYIKAYMWIGPLLSACYPRASCVASKLLI